MGRGTLAGRKGLRERGREKREEEIHLGLNYCLLEITLGCVSARVCLTAGVLTSVALTLADLTRLMQRLECPSHTQESDVRLRTGLKSGLPESEPAGLWDGEQELSVEVETHADKCRRRQADYWLSREALCTMPLGT